MKAVVYTRYGPPDVVQIADIPKPIPKDNEVLIKVRAASLNPYDWHFLRGTPYVARIAMGLRKPKLGRLGGDVAGQVEAVGMRVTQFKPGDEVFGLGRGAFAEYACGPEAMLALKPASVTFEQAASAPIAGITALQGLRDKARLQPGQSVLINGASGGVGTFAVQIAKHFGAEVTGVCSARNLELVHSLGADRVIDYTCKDFTRRAERYDAILDNVGNHSLSGFRRVLTPKGKYVLVGGGGPDEQGFLGGLTRAIAAPFVSRFVSQQMGFFVANMNTKDLTVLAGLIASGKVKPVIEKCYALADLAAALRHLELGHVRGKLLLTL